MVKVLIVCSSESSKVAAFIEDQVIALTKNGCECNYFKIDGKGINGYIKEYRSYLRSIHKFDPDIIHGHYGLSGLFATLQKIKPVVVTYHGSDINIKWVRQISKLSMKRANENIFVSERLKQISKYPSGKIIPCGVDFTIFYHINMVKAREKLNFSQKNRIVLFSSAFDNPVKNYILAKEAINLFDDNYIQLIELKGYNRKEVTLLLNAVDVLLLTSKSEGSPQITKEALACGCPIVATDVGDVKEQLSNIENCYIVEPTANEIKEKLELVFRYNKRIVNNKQLKKYDSNAIARRIIHLYRNILS